MDIITWIIICIIVGLILLACLICCLMRCLNQKNETTFNEQPAASTVIEIEPDSTNNSQSDNVEMKDERQQSGQDNQYLQGGRRYQIREKFFSLGDDFAIKDEVGRDVFFVRSKFLTFGDKLVFEDMAGNGLLKIRQEVWSWAATYTILSASSNQPLATVEQKCTCCFPEFSINSIYGHYEFNGDIYAHSFTLIKNGRIVATVSKQFWAWTDTYGVQVAGGEDHAFILALVIVLDQACHDD